MAENKKEMSFKVKLIIIFMIVSLLGNLSEESNEQGYCSTEQLPVMMSLIDELCTFVGISCLLLLFITPLTPPCFCLFFNKLETDRKCTASREEDLDPYKLSFI